MTAKGTTANAAGAHRDEIAVLLQRAWVQNLERNTIDESGRSISQDLQRCPRSKPADTLHPPTIKRTSVRLSGNQCPAGFKRDQIFGVMVNHSSVYVVLNAIATRYDESTCR